MLADPQLRGRAVGLRESREAVDVVDRVGPDADDVKDPDVHASLFPLLSSCSLFGSGFDLLGSVFPRVRTEPRTPNPELNSTPNSAVLHPLLLLALQSVLAPGSDR